MVVEERRRGASTSLAIELRNTSTETINGNPQRTYLGPEPCDRPLHAAADRGDAARWPAPTPNPCLDLGRRWLLRPCVRRRLVLADLGGEVRASLERILAVEDARGLGLPG